MLFYLVLGGVVLVFAGVLLACLARFAMMPVVRPTDPRLRHVLMTTKYIAAGAGAFFVLYFVLVAFLGLNLSYNMDPS